MAESPVRKKSRRVENLLKRRIDDGMNDDGMSKRFKTYENYLEENICHSNTEGKTSPKRISNFVLACHEVVYDNYVDLKSRFLLKFPPRCVNPANCEHTKLDQTKMLIQVPGYAIEAFKIDFKSHMWSDCIDICRNILRPGSYLPAEVLRNIMEIILNAHDDSASGFSLPYLIDRCRQTMFLIYNISPPCIEKIRTIYKDFLTKPTTVKNSRLLTERKSNGYDEGLFKYCLNCISNELQCEIDEASVPQDDDEMKNLLHQSVATINLQKKKCEVHEALERPERIYRLITVLECLVGILEIDLAIWHSRHIYNSSKYITRSAKPLIACILWTNVLLTGTLSSSCKQILRLFVKLIELEYPDQYVDVMMRIVNTMVQTFDVCEKRTECDYPNPGKYCMHLADGLFTILRGLPIKVVNEVIDKIEPKFFKYILGTKYLQLKLNTLENDIFQISINFLQKKVYSEFEDAKTVEVETLSMKRPLKLSAFYSFFYKVTKVNRRWLAVNSKDKLTNLNTENIETRDDCVTREQIIYLLYITLKYYLEAFRVLEVHDLLSNYSSTNKEDNLLNVINRHKTFNEYPKLNISEKFVKKYRSIFEMLQNLTIAFGEIKESPDFLLFKNFVRLAILEL